MRPRLPCAPGHSAPAAAGRLRGPGLSLARAGHGGYRAGVSPRPSLLGRFRPDGFGLAILAMVALATLAPVRDEAARAFQALVTAAIVLLFFLHGAKLSRGAIAAGLGNWRLHLAVFASTFGLFPVPGLLVRLLPAGLAPPALTTGVLYLCLLPSTVQSSIAFTSVAGGDVPAAVCSASFSNLIGVFATPLLAGLLMHAKGTNHGASPRAVEEILLQLLLPFVIGHLSRPLTARWLDRRKALVNLVDRGSILLVVYAAFSAAVVEGLWARLGVRDLATVLVLDAGVLAAALTLTTLAGRALGFSRPEEITLVFCGSKKSLATGVPMANVLFPAASVGVLIVPLMLFHQLQLMACSALARRYARRRGEDEDAAAVREPASA